MEEITLKLHQNYHEPSQLLCENEIIKLESAFEQSWSRKTCYPPQQNVWSEKNKALGQCAVTALIIHDLYGGQFAYDRRNDHFWNIFPDGSQQDFARKQFTERTIFTLSEVSEREDLINSPGVIKVKTAERYRFLKGKMIQMLEDGGYKL